ncbi:hypothetical protein C8Q72DRAFT_787800, partial [Fomitopsis betulina]
TVELTFPCSAGADLHEDEDHGDIFVRCAVDASLGYSGISWLAGVHSRGGEATLVVHSRYIARRGSLEAHSVLELEFGSPTRRA